MKKSLSVLIFILIIFGLVGTAFAQKIEEADVYYVNAKILKIFPHQKGFYIIYRRAGLDSAGVFIPHKWFSAEDGRGVVQRVNGRIDPYLSFFIKEGKFNHIKVSVPRDILDPVWGELETPSKYDDKFDGVETLELKF